MNVVKKSKECAYDTNAKDICMTDDVLNQIRTFAKKNKNIKASDPKTALRLIVKSYNCETESCLLMNSEINNVVGEEKIKQQLKNRFKPEGPYDSNSWFSNHNIDDVLQQIAKKYESKNFWHVKFHMRDFESNNTTLANADFVSKYNEGIRCFGVVFNTDYSTGKGIHWFAIFGDFSKEPFTIEYFNSTGESPLPEISSWMKSTKFKMEKGLNKKVNDIVVSTIANQKDTHSCGSYSLFYIISRLEGVPYTYFSKNMIGDELMHEFRRNVFRQPN